MWALGCIVFYVFYRLVFRWYSPLWGSDYLDRPMAWSRGWFHIAVLVIAVLLLATSSYFFYLSAGWMAFAPVILIPVSWILYAQKQRYRLNEIIKQAMTIQVEMEQLEQPQSHINDAIMVKLLGEKSASGIGSDSEIHDFMKFYVLSRLGFHYDVSADIQRTFDDPSWVSQSQRLDALIDYWHSHAKRRAAI
jgi:hypothetical protein